MLLRTLALLFSALWLAAPAQAARCGGDFNGFLAQMARDAQAQGVSRAVIDQAFAGVTLDGGVLAFDRRQKGMFHAKSFEEYARTRVIAPRIKRAKGLMVRHAALLSRIERQFGVPAALVVAIWTLETDNGTGDMGKLPVIRTLATLAYDCRRTELFQGELIAALKIVQRGDLPLRDLIGAYAGEIGQTQFLPSSYIKYGVDYDGNGHVDLRHSVPDVLASTANLLKVNGWRAGLPAVGLQQIGGRGEHVRHAVAQVDMAVAVVVDAVLDIRRRQKLRLPDLACIGADKLALRQVAALKNLECGN